jgi:hypothetical protein
VPLGARIADRAGYGRDGVRGLVVNQGPDSAGPRSFPLPEFGRPRSPRLGALGPVVQLRDARGVLAPVYEWFSEGFDTANLKEAKALLDELRD